MNSKKPPCLFFVMAFLLAACSTPATEINVATQSFVATEAPMATASGSLHLLSHISADPQRVEFQAEDGKKLVGYYYPSKYANAPVMILMHSAGGDLCSWNAIVQWMQNRADESPVQLERCTDSGETWHDISWFPPMSAGTSIAVFAFDFRGFGESETVSGSWNIMKLDALAAFETAAKLEGVNPQRMASIGASIGADGAPDGCLLYNQKAGSGCVGALSLSPGNYFGMTYAKTVADLAPNPVWCLAGELDGESAPTCEKASGEHYRLQVYPASKEHGMMLLTPKLDPPVMPLIQDFLELAFGEPVK